jgi:CelD/BcsL family acetyltransferase involved in cellulose biosynthesis
VLDIAVVRPGELPEDEVRRWRELQAADPLQQSPFLSPEFTIAVGRVRPEARVAVLSDGSRIVGFFPYERRQRMIGVPIGAGITDSQGMVHEQGLDWDPVAVLRACRLPVWEFDHLVADQKPFERFHRTRSASPILDLSHGYAGYVEDRGRAGDVVKKAARNERVMGRDLQLPVRFVWEDTNRTAFSALRDWKSAQYQRTQQLDRLRVPWVEAVIEELLGLDTPGCRAVLSTVYLGDRPVAAHLGLRSETILAYWFPAHDVDLARYSPGIFTCLRVAEAAAESGIRQVDLGKSPAAYKDRLKTGETRVAEGRVIRSRSLAVAREAQATLSRTVRGSALGGLLKRGPVGRVLRRTRSRLRG